MNEGSNDRAVRKEVELEDFGLSWNLKSEKVRDIMATSCGRSYANSSTVMLLIFLPYMVIFYDMWQEEELKCVVSLFSFVIS
jgi:hypothetical protein